MTDAALDDLLAFLTPRQVYFLGRLEVAHSNRAFMRKRAKATSTSLLAAKKNVSTFGMFEDCGPSYEADYAQAQGEHQQATANEIACEKFYKKCKHELLEAGAPQDIVEGFVQMLSEQAAAKERATSDPQKAAGAV